MPGEWFANPNWSPDGRQIAFDAFLDGWQGLYVANSDGTGLRRLQIDVGGTGAWSPDGRSIVFAARTLVGGVWQTDLAIVTHDGSRITQLTTTPQSEASPTWSPDGMRLAFARFDQTTRTSDIWVMQFDGSSETQLTKHRARDTEPSWSPDGLRIAFTSYRSVTPPVQGCLPRRGPSAADAPRRRPG